MKKISLVLLILTILIVPSINTVSAVTVPKAPLILPEQSFAFNNVLEINDALFIAAYEADWDTTLYTPQDLFILLTNSINDRYICNGCIQHAPFLPGGLVVVYLTSAELATAGITFGSSSVKFLAQSNPTSFTNSVNSGDIGLVEWISNATIADTAIDIAEKLPLMLTELQILFPEDVLVQDGSITAAGAILSIEVFGPFLTIIPEIFSIAASDIFLTSFAPAGTTALETQINLDNSSSPAFLGLTGLSNGLGLDRSALGFLIVIGLGLPILYITRKEFNSLTLGFSSLSGLLVWWASLGLIPIQIIFILDIFMIAIIGIYFWRQVPTS